MDSVSQPGKVCRDCGERKPESEYYQKRPGQLLSYCKPCHYARGVRWRAENRERAAELAREGYWRDPEKANRQKRAWRQANPGKTQEIDRRGRAKCRPKKQEYRKANAEQIRARNAEYREANAERIRKQSAEYYRANAAEIAERQRAAREADPERFRETMRKSRHKHKARVNARTHKRRARIRGNGGEWTAEEWAAIKRAQDFTCLMCGRREPEIRLTVDHVVPIVMGGLNVKENIQGLCRPCNSRKGDRILDLRGGI